MLTVMIADDEPLARDRLKRLLNNIGGYQVVAECGDGERAYNEVLRLTPDIVLLDIRMPGWDGLKTAHELAKIETPPAVVFCTAFGEYALAAFEANAIGYLLKPVNPEKLADALAKAQRITRPQLAALQGDDDEARKHLSATSRGAITLIAVEHVRLLVADQKYVTVYHRDGEALIDDSLKSLEEEFPQRFLRVHRNALVATDYVTALERDGEGQYFVRVADIEQTVKVSRRLLGVVKDALKQL
jgi:two-component system, LytTR family, response regulator AlgR